MAEDTTEYDQVGNAPAIEPSMGKRGETEKQKQKVGRKRYRAISKDNINVKLFNGSKRHIETMVREFRYSDPNFSSIASATRHYVHIGISAESATSDLRWSLENSVIKKAQKDAVRDELKPHSGNIKNLIATIENLIEENAKNFNDLATRTDLIEAKLDTGFEDQSATLENMTATLEKLLLTGDHSFKNIATLRSLFYIFLLGIQTGRIEPGEANLTQWNNLVAIAQQKAGELSSEELRNLSAEKMESEVIRNLTWDIFEQIYKLPVNRAE